MVTKKLYITILKPYIFLIFNICLIVVVGFLLNRYLEIELKYLFSWMLVFFLFFMNKLSLFEKPPWRFIFLILSIFITFKYFFWRITNTLILTNFFDFLGMMILFLAELYYIILHVLGVIINIWPLEREDVFLDVSDPEKIPTVDVFIPTYNEPLTLVKTTVIMALNIDYPKDKFNVYILDDGSTEQKINNPVSSDAAIIRKKEFSQFAKDVGCKYITRKKNIHAKSGNVNYAFKHTSGELILILDCDHVPTTDILKRTVGYFQRDNKLGLVQTPHFLINPNLVEKNIGGFSNSPRESDMFFNLVHRGLDFWNSSYFCGSAAIIKRAALEKNGGLSTSTITEDVETSSVIHRNGYNSVYVRRPMISGLSPHTYDSLVTQKSRWAQGMIQIFLLKNPLFQKGLSLIQKLSYFNASLYWMFSIPRIIMFLGPLFFFAFGLRIYHASSTQIVANTFPYIFSIFITMNYLYKNTRRLFYSEIYETSEMLFLLPSVISVFLNPRKPVFSVTPKEESKDTVGLNIRAGFPLLILIVSNFLTIFFAVQKWIEYPLYRDVIIIGSVWSLYNIFIAIMTLGSFFQRPDRRENNRLSITGKINICTGECKIDITACFIDISLGGAQISISKEDLELNGENKDDFRVGKSIAFKDKNRNRIQGTILYFSETDNDILLKVKFDENNNISDTMTFVYGSSQRWVNVLRARNTNKLIQNRADYIFFLKRGIFGIFEVCYASVKYFTKSFCLKCKLDYAFGYIKKKMICAK